MNAVIYARFSSHNQTEQSIEGQLKVCYEYAEANGYKVIGEYIDRAMSGKFDNRQEFQRMISDSDRKAFEAVLVYQLDRFARNRYDSAIYKSKLRKNGVRVVSAKENISNDASGILVEGVLESMAEYYSAELSQKINRGLEINAEKCLSNGSNPGLGYKVGPDRRFYIDEEEAAIVREIFERFTGGETKADIVRDLQRRKLKTSSGKEFSYNSLNRLLRNRRYTGVYMYKNYITPGGMPRIIDDDLFERAQQIINKNRRSPCRETIEKEYLLTTKLFCGHCGEMMTGYGGTSKSGKRYNYYICKNARKKKCDKKVVGKEYIENKVIEACLHLMDDERISIIAKKISDECSKDPDSLSVRHLKSAIKEADKAIENLWKAIENGQAVDMLTARIEQRQHEKEELEKQLAMEQNKRICLSEAQVAAFLNHIFDYAFDDLKSKRAIINIFVNKVLVYDDYFTLIINGGNKAVSIENIPFEDISSKFSSSDRCSSQRTPAPPMDSRHITSGDRSKQRIT